MTKLNFACLSVLLFCCLSTAEAGKFNKRVDVGETGTSFENLPGVDEKQHSLRDYQEKKIVVMIFTCNGCPIAKSYEPRIIALQEKYGKNGVQVIAINVNKTEDLDAMKQHAVAQKYNFVYLYDKSEASAKGYGAAVTPQVFVLNEERKIAYMGAFDDNSNPNRVKHHYLTDALDALIKGETPAVTETRAVGCAVKYR